MIKPDNLVDVFGVKPNGEMTRLGKTLMHPTMKAKEIIRELIGHGDFDGDDSEHAMWLYAFEQYGQYLQAYEPGIIE